MLLELILHVHQDEFSSERILRSVWVQSNEHGMSYCL